MTIRVGRTILAALAGVAIVIVAGCSTPPGGSSGSPGSTASNTSPAAVPADFPIGSWTTTLTEADLRAGGITGEGELGENSGVFTLTLGEDGTWTTAQEADIEVRWPVFRGTWTATGPNSFRQVTEFPADFAGDVVDFTWALEDGSLLIAVVNPPDPVLPVIMETHPWTPAD